MSNSKTNQDKQSQSRRDFIIRSGLIIGAAAAGTSIISLAGCSKDEEENVTPAEDLMHEHGLLNRVLLIYDSFLGKINSKLDFPPDALKNSAMIIKEFIEDYHERNEENFLFARMRKENKLVELVNTLQAQHDAGRKITEFILNKAEVTNFKDEKASKELGDKVSAFLRMYRPHEAREDTVLFPEFKKLMSQHEYEDLGEQFEKIEHDKFGEDGFERYLDRVSNIEKQIGIYELNQFTPV